MRKMMNRAFALLCLTLMASFQLFSAPARAYDASWYKTDFWAGEYPHGFTLKYNHNTRIRTTPDPDAPRSVRCSLKKGATYHPWNQKRVKSSKLSFISYIPTVTYVIKAPAKVYLRDEKTEKELEYSFKKGDEWTYLTYYAEGMFKMSFKGKSYAAEQDLMEVSKEKGGKVSNKNRFDHEWMKLRCANGARGWLLLSDTADQPAFGGAKIIEYGQAADAGHVK